MPSKLFCDFGKFYVSTKTALMFSHYLGSFCVSLAFVVFLDDKINCIYLMNVI